MKTLVIGEIPKDFNENKYTIFNPYSYDESSLDENLISQDKFKSILHLDKEYYRQLDQASSSYVLNFIFKNVDYFNDSLNVNQNFIFWKTVLYPWLVSIFQNSLERYLQVESFFFENNESFRIDLIEDNFLWKFPDTTSCHNHMHSVGWNEWLTARMIEVIKPENCEIKYINQNGEANKWPKIKISAINFIRYKFLRTNKIYGLNVYHELGINFLLSSKKPAVKPGKKFEILNIPDEFVALFDCIPIKKIIKKTMPTSIKETGRYIKLLKRKYKKGKFLLGSQHLRGDDLYKIRVGLALEAGELLIGSQHGGDSYGFANHCEEIKENEFSAHSFITWGWEKHGTYKESNFKRLPSPYLSVFLNRHKQINDKVIFISTRKNHCNRFLSARPSQGEWIQSREDNLHLLKKLKEDEEIGEVNYKPYWTDKGALKEKDFLLKKIGDIKFLETDLHNEMLSSKCIILDHPGTTLNISMASNIPTFLFWRKKHFNLQSNAELMLDKLEKNKIFFQSPENLYEHIKNNKNIEKWWNSPDVQRIRLEFFNEFAFTNENWRNDWWAYFKKL